MNNNAGPLDGIQHVFSTVAIIGRTGVQSVLRKSSIFFGKEPQL